MAKTGFSDDGYIIDQDCFSAYPYRTVTSDLNGCGWIAAFNLRRSLGQEADFDAVRAEMDGMFRLRLPGPTTMAVMRRYLGIYVPGFRVINGKSSVLGAAPAARSGILRYTESGVPHFVTFIRLEGGLFRFFNVTDGLEDCVYDMETFIAARCKKGSVRAILPD